MEDNEIIFDVPTFGDSRDDRSWETGHNWVIGIDEEGKIFVVKGCRPPFDLEKEDLEGQEVDDKFPGLYKANLRINGGRDDYTMEYWQECYFEDLEPIQIYPPE